MLPKPSFKSLKQGVFSTRQVENGMLALDIQTGKVKETTDEVTEAFKRLGIQTKEQLALQAKQALMDFETVRNSGQATQADFKRLIKKRLMLPMQVVMLHVLLPQIQKQHHLDCKFKLMKQAKHL
jgi:hypothetical protein